MDKHKCKYCGHHALWKHDEEIGDKDIISTYWCPMCDYVFSVSTDKHECEYYNHCCSRELCDKCVGPQVIYGSAGYISAVGITEADIEGNFDDIEDTLPL